MRIEADVKVEITDQDTEAVAKVVDDCVSFFQLVFLGCVAFGTCAMIGVIGGIASNYM